MDLCFEMHDVVSFERAMRFFGASPLVTFIKNKLYVGYKKSLISAKLVKSFNLGLVRCFNIEEAVDEKIIVKNYLENSYSILI